MLSMIEPTIREIRSALVSFTGHANSDLVIHDLNSAALTVTLPVMPTDDDEMGVYRAIASAFAIRRSGLVFRN